MCIMQGPLALGQKLRYNAAMFTNFFHELKAAKVPVSLREYLTLMEGLDKHVVHGSVEDFYYLARSALVKDERTVIAIAHTSREPHFWRDRLA